MILLSLPFLAGLLWIARDIRHQLKVQRRIRRSLTPGARSAKM